MIVKCVHEIPETLEDPDASVFRGIGPGFITANVDNDANGIYTYSAAGAQFGHLLLWTLIPITLALIVVQEISRAWARLPARA